MEKGKKVFCGQNLSTGEGERPKRRGGRWVNAYGSQYAGNNKRDGSRWDGKVLELKDWANFSKSG